MKTSTNNNNRKGFLQEGFKGSVTEHHKKYLGTTVPKDYFAASKISILEKIKEEQLVVVAPKKQQVFWLRTNFRYTAAASIVFLLCATLWLQNFKNNEKDRVSVTLLSFNEDVLVNSLLVDDTQINAYAEATLINEIVIKAELSEQKLDNLILDAMISEDSLLDNYINDEFIETIIL